MQKIGSCSTDDMIVLFGSELSARCDYEKRVIPSIVTRCIDEVELRGMDVEGVYRKSGGSGQVKLIQAGFEKDGTYDISDEDLDIHAVTSALKQYFRKLPTPLITYDVYDSFLEAGQVTEKEKQQAAMKETLNLLPQSHRDVLEYLVGHLGRVMGMESQNLVSGPRCVIVVGNWFTDDVIDDSAQPFGRLRADDHAPTLHRARDDGYAGAAHGCAGVVGERNGCL